jgi:GrpB-like predicted nucleotidyltransferase (UPF0157 family)
VTAIFPLQNSFLHDKQRKAAAGTRIAWCGNESRLTHCRAMMIGMYTPPPVEYLPHDSESRRVAGWVANEIVGADGSLNVEHIGSTSVPGCWGKGIIDLLVQHNPGHLEATRVILDRIGFQRQTGLEPFPELRPIRLASVEYFGRRYRVHAHVLAQDSNAARDLVRFRDLLRDNICLRRAYEAEKRAILARGAVKGSEYANAKGDFIRRALALTKRDREDFYPAFMDER